MNKRKCNRSITVMLVFVFIMVANQGHADLPVVIQNLQSTPATLFDIGMKQLRRQVLSATTRLSSDTMSAPGARVWLNSDEGIIEILYLYSISAGSGAAPTHDDCAESRAMALKEVFRVGKTAYDIQLSDEARIARRLGGYFSAEPVKGGKETIAMGQRLSELTYLEVKIVNSSKDKSVSCRAPVNQILAQ